MKFALVSSNVIKKYKILGKVNNYINERCKIKDVNINFRVM